MDVLQTVDVVQNDTLCGRSLNEYEDFSGTRVAVDGASSASAVVCRPCAVWDARHLAAV